MKVCFCNVQDLRDACSWWLGERKNRGVVQRSILGFKTGHSMLMLCPLITPCSPPWVYGCESLEICWAGLGHLSRFESDLHFLPKFFEKQNQAAWLFYNDSALMNFIMIPYLTHWIVFLWYIFIHMKYLQLTIFQRELSMMIFAHIYMHIYV